MTFYPRYSLRCRHMRHEKDLTIESRRDERNEPRAALERQGLRTRSPRR